MESEPPDPPLTGSKSRSSGESPPVRDRMRRGWGVGGKVKSVLTGRECNFVSRPLITLLEDHRYSVV